MSEIEQNRQVEVITVEDQLNMAAEQLGFLETRELKYLREQAINERDHDQVINRVSEWQLAAQTYVEKGTDPSDPRPQAGLLFSMAALYTQVHNLEGAFENMKDGLEFAGHLGENEIIDTIESSALLLELFVKISESS